MGIDPGQRRTGLAICEDGLSVAVPAGTVEHTGFDEAVARVRSAIEAADVQQVVIGLPLRLDGSEGQAARRVRRFVDALSRGLEVSIELWDERMSTVSAERALVSQGMDGRARRKVIDQAAATIMLQSYLDAHGESRTCLDDPTDDIALPPVLKGDRSNRRSRRNRRHGR